MVFYSLFLLRRLEFQPLWVTVTALFMLDKVWTVKRLGARAMLTSMALVPELMYDLFQQAVYVVAAFKSLRGSNQDWVAT